MKKEMMTQMMEPKAEMESMQPKMAQMPLAKKAPKKNKIKSINDLRKLADLMKK